MGRSTDILTQTVDQLIAAIEAGADRWEMPWLRLGADILSPSNAATGHRYRGGNRFLLAFIAYREGFDTGTWATYRQWQEAGGQVREGEHAIAAILRPIPRERAETDEATGEEVTHQWVSFRPFWVFHASQVNGWEPPALTDHEPIAAAETLVAAWETAGMTVVAGGDRSYYHRGADTVHIPQRGQFRRIEHWYSTLAHEAAHWTGPRLGRTFGERFGDDAYAAEELTAELAAAIIGGHVGLDQAVRDDHASYLAGWVRILRESPHHLWTFAGAAEDAATYLLELGTGDQQEAQA